MTQNNQWFTERLFSLTNHTPHSPKREKRKTTIKYGIPVWISYSVLQYIMISKRNLKGVQMVYMVFRVFTHMVDSVSVCDADDQAISENSFMFQKS